MLGFHPERGGYVAQADPTERRLVRGLAADVVTILGLSVTDILGEREARKQAAFDDDAHVDVQRDRYRRRLELGRDLLAAFGVPADLPAGGFYLWAPAPGGDAWALTRQLAEKAGVLVSPGEFYGSRGAGHVRLAVVQPDERLALAAARLGL